MKNKTTTRKDKKTRNVCSLVVYSEYKFLLRLLMVEWIFRHLASQWNKICVKSLSVNKWFALSISLLLYLTLYIAHFIWGGLFLIIIIDTYLHNILFIGEKISPGNQLYCFLFICKSIESWKLPIHLEWMRKAIPKRNCRNLKINMHFMRIHPSWLFLSNVLSMTSVPAAPSSSTWTRSMYRTKKNHDNQEREKIVYIQNT